MRRGGREPIHEQWESEYKLIKMRVEKVRADPTSIKKWFNSEVMYKKNAQMIDAVDKCLGNSGSIPVSL